MDPNVNSTISGDDLVDIMQLPMIMGLPDGSYMETISVGDVDAHFLYSVQVCIIYASQLGASLTLLLVMVLASQAERRRTPMFALNVVALILNFLRLLLGCLYFTGPFNETYVYFAEDFSPVPRSAYSNSVGSVVISLLLFACLLAAMSMQTYVVLVTMTAIYKQMILLISGIIGLLGLAFRLAFAVINVRAILLSKSDDSFDQVILANTVITSLTIIWFSGIFSVKLGHTVWKRHTMGVRRFGSMEILLVMGGQTLIIPAIFAILQFFPIDIPVMDSNVLTLVTIFLPLSSLWASSIVDVRKARCDAEMGMAMGMGMDMAGKNSAATFTSGCSRCSGCSSIARKPLIELKSIEARYRSEPRAYEGALGSIDESLVASASKTGSALAREGF